MVLFTQRFYTILGLLRLSKTDTIGSHILANSVNNHHMPITLFSIELIKLIKTPYSTKRKNLPIYSKCNNFFFR